MKKILCLYAVTLFTYTANAQKLDIGFNYNADVPFKQTMPMMSMNNGCGLFIGYKAWQRAPLWFTTDLSTGCFAYKTMKEDYTFSDGTTTQTYVNYSSNLHKFLFGMNCDLGHSKDLLSGYLTAQGGYAIMNAKIYIEDPNDPGGCKALVNKNTFNYGGPVYAVGGGVRVNINRMRKREDVKGFQHFIDIGVKYMGGGTFDYVNIKNMEDHSHPMVASGSAGTTQPNGTRDLNVQFVNVTTNNIHEHKVAEIYSSKFEMLNIKIGYVMRF